MKFPKVKKVKQPKLSKLKEKLWKLFAIFIKNRDGNTCISCGRTGLVGGRGGNWDAGHFLGMNVCNFKYKYDERNVHSQCSYCNCWLHGNYVEYRKAMILKYGEAEVLKMEEEYRQPLEMNFNEREYVEFLIEKYSL